MSQVGYKPISRFSSGIKSVPTYVEFGKFVIHKKKLLDNILIVKYKNSKAPVPVLKQQTISVPLATLLLNLIDTEAINYELVKDCEDKDRILFENLLKRADLERVLGYNKLLALKTDQDAVDRFQILKGEICAGNDALDIRKELRDIVKLFVEKGRIDKEMGRELMTELFS